MSYPDLDLTKTPRDLTPAQPWRILEAIDRGELALREAQKTLDRMAQRERFPSERSRDGLAAVIAGAAVTIGLAALAWLLFHPHP